VAVRCQLLVLLVEGSKEEGFGGGGEGHKAVRCQLLVLMEVLIKGSQMLALGIIGKGMEKIRRKD
jgi:hypothetical protein